ncbi:MULTISPECIES: hypothetical protein [unclassified Paenibacillus]|uniref:hypothetical protein n=1 Tax=unclassified Paenibacillus TaxID=185978 RepID=UPI0012FD9D09|nr:MULTISPECIES: hypothetical protein [unclassified Paenibacillus]QID16119.1 hypothetical protein CIC07_25700 [Paenibacillus sp. RUD330]
MSREGMPIGREGQMCAWLRSRSNPASSGIKTARKSLLKAACLQKAFRFVLGLVQECAADDDEQNEEYQDGAYAGIAKAATGGFDGFCAFYVFGHFNSPLQWNDAAHDFSSHVDWMGRTNVRSAISRCHRPLKES